MAVVRELVNLFSFEEKPGSGSSNMESKFQTLKSSATNVLAGITAVTGAIGTMVAATDQLSKAKDTMRAMTDGTEEFRSEWERMTEFAESTPFSVDQSINAWTRLKQTGVSTSNEMIRALGNMAAGTGKNMDQMVEAVADATRGEFERLKEFGIAAEKAGDQVKFTYKGVTQTVENEAGAIANFLKKTGQENFAGLMEQRMQRLGPAFTAVADKVKLFFLEVQEAGALQDTLVPILQSVASGLDAARKGADSLAKTVGDALTVAVAVAVGPLAAIGTLLWGALEAISFVVPGLNAMEVAVWLLVGAFSAWMGFQWIQMLSSAVGIIWGKVAALNAAQVAAWLNAAAAAAMWAAYTGGAILLLLLLEDIWTWFQGGDSMFGDFLNWGLEMWNSLEAKTNEFMNWIRSKLPGPFKHVFDVIQGWYTLLIKLFTGQWQDAFNMIKGWIDKLWSLASNIPGVGDNGDLAVAGAGATSPALDAANNATTSGGNQTQNNIEVSVEQDNKGDIGSPKELENATRQGVNEGLSDAVEQAGQQQNGGSV